MAGIHSGEIAYAIFNGVLASLGVGWLFLRLYRRAVEKTMRTSAAGKGTALHAVPAPVAPRAVPPPSVGARSSAAVRRNLALAYGLAFVLSALALSAPELREFTRESSAAIELALQTLVIVVTNASPAIVLIGFLVAAPARRIFRAFVIVWIAGCVLTVGIPVIGRMMGGRSLDAGLAMNAYYFTIALALNALPPLVLVFLTGRPRIRNVMPLVLAVVVLLSLALTIFDAWLKGNVDDAQRVNALLRWAVGNLGATFGPALLFLMSSLPVGVLGWWAIGRVASGYEAKKFSDMQLIVDAWWGVVVALHLVTLWRYGAAVSVTACIAAYVIYLFGSRLAVKALRLSERTSGPSLLLLRVFGFQARTERLFDAVAARWRFEGTVAMIAGADLALRSVDAGEALAFVRGDIDSSYVGNDEKLAERLRDLEHLPDPDGRFRIAQFFCYDDTWRATLESLITRSSIVLMDLRGFTKANAGCVFELQQLSSAGRLVNCVFVTDDTSDRTLAAACLGLRESDAEPWVAVRKLDPKALNTLWVRLMSAARR